MSRRKTAQKLKNRLRENARQFLQLRKRHGQYPLHIAFQSRHLAEQTLPLTRQIPKIGDMRSNACLCQCIHVHQEKLCDDQGIFLVCLGLPQLHLHEVGNEQGVDEDNRISPGKKKREQIDVIAGGRLHADQKALPGYR